MGDITEIILIVLWFTKYNTTANKAKGKASSLDIAHL